MIWNSRRSSATFCLLGYSALKVLITTGKPSARRTAAWIDRRCDRWTGAQISYPVMITIGLVCPMRAIGPPLLGAKHALDPRRVVFLRGVAQRRAVAAQRVPE